MRLLRYNICFIFFSNASVLVPNTDYSVKTKRFDVITVELSGMAQFLSLTGNLNFCAILPSLEVFEKPSRCGTSAHGLIGMVVLS